MDTGGNEAIISLTQYMKPAETFLPASKENESLSMQDTLRENLPFFLLMEHNLGKASAGS